MEDRWKIEIQSRVYRDRARKAKARMEYNLARDIRGNKKGIYKYISSKRNSREIMSSLFDFQVSYSILIDKLMKRWLDEWTVTLTEN